MVLIGEHIDFANLMKLRMSENRHLLAFFLKILDAFKGLKLIISLNLPPTYWSKYLLLIWKILGEKFHWYKSRRSLMSFFSINDINMREKEVSKKWWLYMTLRL